MGKLPLGEVRIPQEVLASQAFRFARPSAIKVLLVITALEYRDPRAKDANGVKVSTNGRKLFASVRSLADATGLSTNTVEAALKELMQLGLLEKRSTGSFHAKGGPASVWALPWLPIHNVRGPVNDYERWRPHPPTPGEREGRRRVLRSQILGAGVSKTETDAATAVSPAAAGVSKSGGVDDNAEPRCHPETETHITRGYGGRADAVQCNTLRAVAAELISNGPPGTQSALGRRAGVSLPTLSRFLARPGRTVTVEAHARLMTVASEMHAEARADRTRKAQAPRERVRLERRERDCERAARITASMRDANAASPRDGLEQLTSATRKGAKLPRVKHGELT